MIERLRFRLVHEVLRVAGTVRSSPQWMLLVILRWLTGKRFL